MKIDYAGTFTKEDLRKALTLHLRFLKLTRWINGFFLFLFLIGVIAVRYGDTLRMPPSPYWIWLVFMITFLTFPWWIIPLQVRSISRMSPFLRDPISGSFDDEKVKIHTIHADSDCDWNMFVKYKASDDVLMLYENKMLFHPFNKRMFASQADWENCLNLVKSKIHTP